ncbi:hypothetical protein P4B35_13480 [Pontiellaceae bacterium B12227]|nr:hypothetical protein [Pontiellaceae bacterium B12227]
MKASLSIIGFLFIGVGAFSLALSETIEEMSIHVDEIRAGTVVLRAELPNSFSNKVEFYACESLASNGWKVASDPLAGWPDNQVEWTDSSNGLHQASCFYRVGDAERDSDGDSIPDAREIIMYGTSPDRADTDYDGVEDAVELETPGLDAGNPDSDGDGIPDGEELRWGCADPTVFDVLSSDDDGDLLPFMLEYSFGTDPSVQDSDGDGVWDGVEVEQGSNPADPADEGRAPSTNDWVEVSLSLSDIGSGEELFVLRMGDLRILSGEAGQVFRFSKGWKYEAEVVLAGSCAEVPERSYVAAIQGVESNTVFMSSPNQLQDTMPVEVFIPKFEYSIYVDQPDPGNRDIKYKVISLIPLDLFVGHTWWQLRAEPAEFVGQFVKSADRARFLNITTGFYPAGYPDDDLSKSTQSTLAEVFSPEVFFSADVIKTYSVDWLDLLNALDFVVALDASPGIFDLSLHNCSDVSLEVAALCGHILPDTYGSWSGGGGTNPADLGEDLRALP